MATSKEIRRRIRSATNTKQIIKAMELVSVVKTQKAVAANTASRPYSAATNEIINDIVHRVSPTGHIYLRPGSGKRQLVVLITTDRGLCGSLNAKVVKKFIENFDLKTSDVIVLGKKGRDLLRIFSANLIAEFDGITDRASFKKEFAVLKLIEGEYRTSKYEKVCVIYPHFISTLAQEPKVIQLLPLRIKTDEAVIDSTVYEPSKGEVLDELIPRSLEIKLWQTVQESIASEHASRMVTMKNANENAEELIDDLTLSFNQTRQAGITRELAEISAGKMTLEE